MSVVIDGTSGLTTPGVVNTAGETIATTLAVTGASTLTGAVSSGTITLLANGVEGGAIDFLNSGNASTGMNIDVSTEDVGRIFSVRNSFSLQLGQLAGTGGVVTIYTAATERMRIDSSGNLLFNSGYGSVATAYGCRAWVNFNGTGTVAIRASGNVSSITDNGTGDYTVNFTTAMPDANYMATQSVGNNNYGVAGVAASAGSTSALLLQTTTQYRIYSTQVASGTSNIDAAVAFVAIFR